jgi:hypothetical protein
MSGGAWWQASVPGVVGPLSALYPSVALDRAFKDCRLFASLTVGILLKGPASERARCREHAGCPGV